MKIKEIKINGFKRFTELTVSDIPETTRLVVLVGPNGSGKTSLFESFNHWHRYNGYNSVGNKEYFEKKNDVPTAGNWYTDKVDIKFYNDQILSKEFIKNIFYFRTAYRNEADFNISNLEKQNDPTKSIKLETLMLNDITVSENYQRLIAQTLAGVYEGNNDAKSVLELREELIGKIKESLGKVFDDLNLSSIGDPLTNGSFYFRKGIVNDFHYKNLSAGEKSVFDLLLDMIIKASFYPDSVFCIDEPEAHMHTRLQSKVLKELYSLTPEKSQLWISTHSIGMLKQAEELEEANPGTVIFLDFDDRDFDSTEIIKPAKINKTIWNRFFDLAFGDFSKLISPTKIVFCEGNPSGRKYKNLDAQIYEKIFENKYHNTKFVSIGSYSEVEDLENKSIIMLAEVLKTSEVIKFVDRDDKSGAEIAELFLKGIKTSSRRNLDAISQSIKRGNAKDDIKSASGEIFVNLKKILGLTQCGNNKCSFMRDTLSSLITEDTQIYKDLEKEIFLKK